MKALKGVLPYIVIILSGIFMVFLVLDRYNPTINFVGNSVSVYLLWAFCILSIINSAIVSAANRKEKRRKMKQ